MGLTDLKKNSTLSKSAHQKIQTSQLALDDLIDDFINDANRYAVGEAQLAPSTNKVIELNFNKNPLNLSALNVFADDMCVIAKSATIKRITKGNAPFRKSTFTLSESAIAHLATLADDGDVAKSKLVRFLIEHHFNKTQQERREIEKSIIVE
ncbi:CopG family transcriptional regulator [Shewanella gelidimarina]|uniref:CopG family transcriptional regulator n=1 Tax=Shewanella gelidimarina TaxID=56813 RepID=UPI00200D7386|nr:CopG family transcriptional regulator [Shewanella gelidimarina]MCL1059043.1 CopG family transcriptional regulator [Shewanella gelidimarina]